MSSSKKFPRILNYKNLDFEKIEYYQPQRTNDGCLLSTIYYKLMNNNPLSMYIETPKLKTISGIIKDGEDYYIEMELSLEGYDSNFYTFIEKIDEKNVLSCHFNSNIWFNKQLPLKTIEQFYKSPIKINMNGKNPTMLLKIPTYKGKILLEVYNQQKKLINMNKLCINDEMVAIIKFSGLRFLKQKFIAEWEIYKIKLLKVIDEDNLPSGYFFSDDADANIELQQPVQEESLEESNIFFNLEEDEQQINFINDNNINEKQLIETKEVKVETNETVKEKTTNINNENDNDNDNHNDYDNHNDNHNDNDNNNDNDNEETSNQVQEELEKEPNNDDNEESNNQVREEPKEELNNDNNDDDNDNDNEESNNQVQEELKEELNNDNNDNNNDDDNEEINNQSKEEIKDTNDDVIDNDEYNSNSEEDIDYEFTDSEYELDLDDELDELTLTNNFEHIKKETKKKLLLQEKEKKEEEMAKIQKELETMNN